MDLTRFELIKTLGQGSYGSLAGLYGDIHRSRSRSSSAGRTRTREVRICTEDLGQVEDCQVQRGQSRAERIAYSQCDQTSEQHRDAFADEGQFLSLHSHGICERRMTTPETNGFVAGSRRGSVQLLEGEQSIGREHGTVLCGTDHSRENR